MNKNQEKVLDQIVHILSHDNDYDDPWVEFQGSVTSNSLKWPEGYQWPKGSGVKTIKDLVKEGYLLGKSEHTIYLTPNFDCPCKVVPDYKHRWPHFKRIRDAFWEAEGGAPKWNDRVVTKYRLTKVGEAYLRGETDNWKDSIS